MSSSAPASASTRRAVTRSRPKLIKFYSPETAVKYKLMMQSENELSFYRDDIRAFVDLLGLASPAAPRRPVVLDVGCGTGDLLNLVLEEFQSRLRERRGTSAAETIQEHDLGGGGSAVGSSSSSSAESSSAAESASASMAETASVSTAESATSSPAHAPALVGVDTSESMLKHARVLVPSATFSLGDAVHLGQFSDGSARGIICTFLTHHLEDDEFTAAVGEFARVVADDCPVYHCYWHGVGDMQGFTETKPEDRPTLVKRVSSDVDAVFRAAGFAKKLGRVVEYEWGDMSMDFYQRQKRKVEARRASENKK